MRGTSTRAQEPKDARAAAARTGGAGADAQSAGALAGATTTNRWYTSFRLWAPLLHLAALAAILTGVTWQALVLGVGLYAVRMFGITAGYHRYFAHRAFKTSRPMQLLLGFLGTMAFQRGPLWWASTHRTHHRYADTPKDPHSPVQKGFWWAHVGWLAGRHQEETDPRMVRDLAKYPELRWLERYHWVGPVAMGFGAFLVAGWSGVVVGAIWSTLALWHCTFAINSLAHVLGWRRFETPDDSRNNWWLALLTFGEGWHNNHHHDMSAARQGYFWWEVDLSYYALKVLAWMRLVHDLRPPRSVRPEARAVATPPVELPAAVAKLTSSWEPSAPRGTPGHSSA